MVEHVRLLLLQASFTRPMPPSVRRRRASGRITLALWARPPNLLCAKHWPEPESNGTVDRGCCRHPCRVIRLYLATPARPLQVQV